MKHVIACVEAMVEVLGDEVGLALDCGPGWTLPDAIRFARAVEPLNLLWLEDMLTGDYVPYVNADVYRELTQATSTPIHTGEQIYLRQNFKELIERHAVNVVGPDPCDVGGIAELKWIAEYAHLHGILMAPHGTGNGLLGLAALVQVCATLPQNYIAFELPAGDPKWWYDIVDGLPDPIVRNGRIEVWDRPGMGVEIDPEKARPYLAGGGRRVLRLRWIGGSTSRFRCAHPSRAGASGRDETACTALPPRHPGRRSHPRSASAPSRPGCGAGRTRSWSATAPSPSSRA